MLFLAFYGGLAVAIFGSLLRDAFLNARSSDAAALPAAAELSRQDRTALSWVASS